MEAFNAALALDRENPSAAIGLAQTYSFQGHHPQAIAAAEQLRAKLGEGPVRAGHAGVRVRACRPPSA